MKACKRDSVIAVAKKLIIRLIDICIIKFDNELISVASFEKLSVIGISHFVICTQHFTKTENQFHIVLESNPQGF